MKFAAVLSSCLCVVVSAHCKTCYSVGDPHFQTFNGDLFDFHEPGWQTLFQKGGYVIQTFHEEYNGNGVAVNKQVRYYTPSSQGWLGGISGIATWPGNSVTLSQGTELLHLQAIPTFFGYDVYVTSNMEDNCCGLCCDKPPSTSTQKVKPKFPTGKKVKVTKAQAQKACARLKHQRKNCITDLQMANDPKAIANIVTAFKDVETTVMTLAKKFATKPAGPKPAPPKVAVPPKKHPMYKNLRFGPGGGRE